MLFCCVFMCKLVTHATNASTQVRLVCWNLSAVPGLLFIVSGPTNHIMQHQIDLFDDISNAQVSVHAAKGQSHEVHMWKRVDGYADGIYRISRCTAADMLCNSDLMKVMHLMAERQKGTHVDWPVWGWALWTPECFPASHEWGLMELHAHLVIVRGQSEDLCCSLAS